VTLTVAQAFKVALDMWEIAQEGEGFVPHLFRLYMSHSTERVTFCSQDIICIKLHEN